MISIEYSKWWYDSDGGHADLVTLDERADWPESVCPPEDDN